jgi:hypothetical protein
MLGTVRGGVEADLLENLDGHGMNIAGRLRTGAGDVGHATDGATEDGLREMAPAGVAGAEDEDEGFAHSYGEKSAATGTRLTGVRDADIGGQTIGLLGREEEDAFAAFDDGANYREYGQEGEVVFDFKRHIGRADEAGATVEDMQGLGAADAMVGIIGRPQLETGGDVGPDDPAAVDVTLLDAGDFREVQVNRG